MKKRMFALLAAAVLLLSPAALAQEQAAEFRVFDDAGLFSAEEAETLQAAILDFQENTGYDFAVWTSDTDNGDADYQALSDAFYKDHSLGLGMNHTAILCYLDLFGDGYYYISVFGDLKNFMVEEDIQYLADKGMEYFSDGDIVGGFTWTVNMLTEALANIGNMNETVRVYDFAEFLSDEQAAQIEAAIADFRALSGMDFLYLSTYDEMEGNDEGSYMAEFYTRHGFGDGDNSSGAVIYLDLLSGNYYLQNFGDMREVVSQADLGTIVSGLNPLMSEGKVAEAVLKAIDAYAAFFR